MVIHRPRSHHRPRHHPRCPPITISHFPSHLSPSPSKWQNLTLSLQTQPRRFHRRPPPRTNHRLPPRRIKSRRTEPPLEPSHRHWLRSRFCRSGRRVCGVGGLWCNRTSVPTDFDCEEGCGDRVWDYYFASCCATGCTYPFLFLFLKPPPFSSSIMTLVREFSISSLKPQEARIPQTRILERPQKNLHIC